MVPLHQVNIKGGGIEKFKTLKASAGGEGVDYPGHSMTTMY